MNAWLFSSDSNVISDAVMWLFNCCDVNLNYYVQIIFTYTPQVTSPLCSPFVSLQYNVTQYDNGKAWLNILTFKTELLFNESILNRYRRQAYLNSIVSFANNVYALSICVVYGPINRCTALNLIDAIYSNIQISNKQVMWTVAYIHLKTVTFFNYYSTVMYSIVMLKFKF